MCDLQGGIYSDGFVITDPVIMSQKQEYGPTDLGNAGISTFFSYHVCNSYCQINWTSPKNKNAAFRKQKGTTMTLPTAYGRNPLSKNYEY